MSCTVARPGRTGTVATFGTHPSPLAVNRRGLSRSSHDVPVTVPMTLPQYGGGSTCMRMLTVLTPYGVSLGTSTTELYLPGWLTALASAPTQIEALCDG
jgi:hypothetical protein